MRYSDFAIDCTYVFNNQRQQMNTKQCIKKYNYKRMIAKPRRPFFSYGTASSRAAICFAF